MNAALSELSIIIVNYNTLALLRDCLSSLMQSEAAACEVIVVDNASADGSPAMVEREFPQVRLIRNVENTGFAKANNQGMRSAQGKFVLLLNSDTIVRPGAITAMAEFLGTHPDVGGVGCKLLNADGSIQPSISNQPGPVMLCFRLLGISRLIADPAIRRRLACTFGVLLGRTAQSYLAPYVAQGPALEVESMSAACLMLRKAAVDRIGPLDEGFFMYLEDMDYCVRLREDGWKLFYLPSAEIVHLGGASSGGRMRNYSPASYRALFYFYRKHFALPTVVAARAMVATMLGPRWLWNWIASKLSERPAFRQNATDLKQVIRVCFEPIKRA